MRESVRSNVFDTEIFRRWWVPERSNLKCFQGNKNQDFACTMRSSIITSFCTLLITYCLYWRWFPMKSVFSTFEISKVILDLSFRVNEQLFVNLFVINWFVRIMENSGKYVENNFHFLSFYMNLDRLTVVLMFTQIYILFRKCFQNSYKKPVIDKLHVLKYVSECLSPPSINIWNILFI